MRNRNFISICGKVWAKRVIAVDASAIAEKAAKIVKANGLDDIITYDFPFLPKNDCVVIPCAALFEQG